MVKFIIIDDDVVVAGTSCPPLDFLGALKYKPPKCQGPWFFKNPRWLNTTCILAAGAEDLCPLSGVAVGTGRNKTQLAGLRVGCSQPPEQL